MSQKRESENPGESESPTKKRTESAFDMTWFRILFEEKPEMLNCPNIKGLKFTYDKFVGLEGLEDVYTCLLSDPIVLLIEKDFSQYYSFGFPETDTFQQLVRRYVFLHRRKCKGDKCEEFGLCYTTEILLDYVLKAIAKGTPSEVLRTLANGSAYLVKSRPCLSWDELDESDQSDLDIAVCLACETLAEVVQQHHIRGKCTKCQEGNFPSECGASSKITRQLNEVLLGKECETTKAQIRDLVEKTETHLKECTRCDKL